MVEVTQEDVAVAEQYFATEDPADVFHGTALAEYLARHRIAAFNAGLEAAAKVAEQTKSYDDTLHKSGGFSTTGERISTAIRSLKIGEE